MFDSLKDSVSSFSEKAKETVAEKEVTEEMLEDLLWDLEQQLLKSNVAVDVIDRLKQDMKEELVGESVPRRKAGAVVESALEDAVRDVLQQESTELEKVVEKEKPALILFMGFNGSGKTTTAAKVAHMLKDRDYGPVMAAGDTFRSASIEQLQEHAENLGVECISHEYGSDPAAVIYDAMEHAKKEGKDAVLADTAGRAHSDRNLMDELEKIVEVNEPDMKLLVVDALAGNDVLEQAEAYDRIGFDALVLTKADIDEKGGAALSLGYVTGKPILYLGTGQGYQDLERFDAESLVERLVDSED
ncbi:MAG: signal recognition particle-docking protein FtsY [Candidatus Nanohaloarchaeota archaeon QJJ-7]|nr:signal recognition particle-docking protein FtsY [Candidatus Nanohaloarchaeota archaeon QJJ-7]